MGLAPDTAEESYVSSLFNQGKIEKHYVGLNFEYPEDTHQTSTITFGWFDYGQAKGGEEGMLWYDNVGINTWAMLVKDFSYGQTDL